MKIKIFKFEQYDTVAMEREINSWLATLNLIEFPEIIQVITPSSRIVTTILYREQD